MNVNEINQYLSRGEIEHKDLWPHLMEMKAMALKFRFEFGLDELPCEPGLITIRGPRQYGKSTWLELQLRGSIQKFGKGSAYYLNGDEITSADQLAGLLIDISHLYHPEAQVKRLFIDEITAIPDWQRAIKRTLDSGRLRDVLIVTTGSKAIDLRRGGERLPGRKGRLSRSEYVFLPVSYRQFHKQTAHKLGKKTWIAYLLTGGSPLACNDIFQLGRLPEYFIQLIRDWIIGELVASGRSRITLSNLMSVLFKFGGAPVGFAKLAREAGLANNTVASGYIEQLSDLMCVLPSWPLDMNKGISVLRKPAKFHFINLAAVVSLHPARLHSINAWETLPPPQQSMFLEWLVAQEIWRRAVLAGDDNPEAIAFWQSKTHEIDFITPAGDWLEVKRGQAGPHDFSWFPQVIPHKKLKVICSTPFKATRVEGITLEEFLLDS